MTPSGMGTTGGGCHSNAQKDKASEGTLRFDRATVCAATSKPLRAPVVICELGHLLNKEDVIELMLSKALPPHLSHIKSLKALHDATLHPNPAFATSSLGHTAKASEDDDEPPFFCPVAMLPLNGRYPFVLVKPTGHVVSQRALKQVGSKLCPVTETPLSGADAVLSINPPEEERAELLEQLQAKKAEKKGKSKAAAAATAAAGAVSTAEAWAPSGAPMPAPASTSSRSAGGGAAASAAGVAASSGKARSKVEGGKRPRSEWEAANKGIDVFAQKAAASDTYKSLFISAEQKKKQEKADAANFCARSIVPSVNHSGFGLG